MSIANEATSGCIGRIISAAAIMAGRLIKAGGAEWYCAKLADFPRVLIVPLRVDGSNPIKSIRHRLPISDAFTSLCRSDCVLKFSSILRHSATRSARDTAGSDRDSDRGLEPEDVIS